MTRKSTNTLKVCLIFIFLFFISNSQSTQPVNYKDYLINMAIQDGLNTVDGFVRSTFWYYLRGSKLLNYRVKITPTYLNYRIIYMGAGGIFMINSGLNKIKWQTQMNNIVRLNAQIVKYY